MHQVKDYEEQYSMLTAEITSSIGKLASALNGEENILKFDSTQRISF